MMQVDLYAAVSVDGFVAREDGDSDWVQDDELFEHTAKEYGCVALGRTTFEQYEGELYPLKGVQHIVLTSDTKPKSEYKNVHFAHSVAAAIEYAEKLGFKKLLVIGGAKTNASFANASVLQRLLLDPGRASRAGVALRV